MIISRRLPGLGDWIESVEGRRRRRSNPGVGHVVNPAGVFQVLREQNGMSMPIRATLWITWSESPPLRASQQ